MFARTYFNMPSLSPDPGFQHYYKACRKGDAEVKAVTVNESPVRAIADASEITGLPRHNFEVYEIIGHCRQQVVQLQSYASYRTRECS